MKTILYIDTFNLYYGALKGTPYKWLNPVALARLVLDASHDITAVKYFTAKVVPRPENPGQLTRQLFYLRALMTLPGASIIHGRYLTHNVTMPLANPPPGGPRFVVVMKNEEKGSDVNLASHMLLDAFDNSCDCAVLISGDSDFYAPVDIVKNRFKKVVGVINPQRKICRKLNEAANFYERIRESALAASQFPNQLRDAQGAFHKPPGW